MQEVEDRPSEQMTGLWVALSLLPAIVRSDYIPRIHKVRACTYRSIRETLEVFDHGDA